MESQSLPWLKHLRDYEPTYLVKYTSAILRVASSLGWLSWTSAQVGVIDAQLPILIPLVVEIVTNIIVWFAHRWLRSKVTPQARAEPIATALLNVERARGEGAPVKVPLKATRAAKRVLGVDAGKIENPL